MWDQLKVLFSLLDRLVRIRYHRRTETFDQVLRPLFERFVAVHILYNELFVTTLRRIPDLSPRGLLLHDKPIDAAKLQRQMANVKKRFGAMRARDIHMRDRLRRECREIVSAVGTVEEKRFLVSVIFYFVEDGIVEPGSKLLDAYALLIEADRAGHTFRSPSMFTQERISQVDDPADVRQIVDEHRNLLNQKFSDVCAAFTKLQLAIATQS